MSLRSFYDQIGPYLLGQQSHQETTRKLYGQEAESSQGSDAARLRIYGRFCRIHRHEVLDFVFVHCRATVVRQGGEAAWAELVDSYFVAHPMHCFELNQNGEYFPGFLGGLAAAGKVAPFLGELADLEWWEWLVETTPDVAIDLKAGAPQLHYTVELRSYSYDLLDWIDHQELAPTAPTARANIVLFWRNRELRGRREPASQLELMVIKAVVERVPLDGALATLLGIEPETLRETVDDLASAGILVGVADGS